MQPLSGREASDVDPSSGLLAHLRQSGATGLLALMITVATFAKNEEAHLLRMRLEAGGIPAIVADENVLQLEFSGVHVQVAEEHAAAARELLNAQEAAPAPTSLPEV